MKTKIITIFFIALTKLCFGQYPQYEQLVTPYLSDSIRSGFFYFKTPNNFQTGVLYQLYRQSVPDLNNNMVLINQHIDNTLGFNHYKYQQTFMNIPIEGAGCIEHFDKNGSLLFLNAKIADSIKSDAQPKLSSEEAIKIVISILRDNPKVKFAWESDEWEQQIRSDHSDSSATWFPSTELIFAVDDMQNMTVVIDGSRYTLAYKVSVKTIYPTLETFFYYVDALNGNILKMRSSHREVSGDVYGYGNRNLDTKWRGGFIQKYELDAEDWPHNYHTKKWDGYTSWDNMDETRSSATNWGSTYLTETSTHFHVGNTWDYFYNTHGRNGMDGLGGEIRVKTQWNKDNAYYDGYVVPNELVFGKTASAWDLGMDPSIVAHEFTHGITRHTANLVYEYEPGALDESFSDIFGIVVQAQTLDGGNTDWIQGNHIPNNIQRTRSLNTPNLRGEHWSGNYDANGYPIFSIGQPDSFQGNYWCNCPLSVDLGGVHVNSGVQNKWFYALSEGETNPGVQGIGMKKAAKIAYYALTNTLMNSAQFTDSKEATIAAAIHYYGECSQEHISTVDAWNHVGIYAGHNCGVASVNEIVDQNEVYVYPNPTSSILFVEIPKLSDNPIRIFDVNGKFIKEIKTTEIYFQTDISNLENGVYLIYFDFKGQTVVKRIIVQK